MRRAVVILLSSTVSVLMAPAAWAEELGSAPNADEGSAEIVVTAQKRTQSLFDLPQSAAVLDSALLEGQQLTSVSDFQRLLPGLAAQQADPGQSMLVLRGITTGSVNPTVAVYIDDTPFGASTGQANAAALSGDFDTFDMDRIELLRGPQGTLYGASSLGGVLRYITTPPNPDAFKASGSVGLYDVDGGAPNWTGNAMLNVPLADTMALRASGFYRRQGGFIDASNSDRRNINESDSYGGRASLLVKATDTFSIRASALFQNFRTKSKSSYDADPETFAPLGFDIVSGNQVDGYRRADFGVEKTSIDYRLYNVTADLDLDFATLTSATSYGRLYQDDISDQTLVPAAPGVSLGDVLTGAYGSPTPLGVQYANQVTMTKFTQEARLASPGNQRVEWVLGVYYTREGGLLFQNYLPYDLSTRVRTAVPLLGFDHIVQARLQSVYKEYAAFVNATWNLSPVFDITAGARWSRNTQDTDTSIGGFLVGGDTAQLGNSDENVLTWSVAPRFEITDDVAVFARVAKGFRPGGPNAPVPGLPDFSSTFRSDTLLSYELGLRGATSDRRFSWDASLYYLDWNNIQVPVVVQVPGVGPINVDGNGDGARSYGAELAATFRPGAGLVVTGNFSYNSNRLDGDLADGSGLDGERLPISPKYSANIDVSYTWALGPSVEASLGGNVNMVSDRVARYDGAYRAAYGANAVMDGYATLDLRARLDFDNVNLSLFARNVTNSAALTNVGAFGERPGAISAYRLRPRTLGVQFGASF